MSYPIFQDFCESRPQSSITLIGSLGADIEPGRLHGFVGALNEQPSVQELVNFLLVNGVGLTAFKAEKLANALLTMYFIRQQLPTGA